MYDVNSWNPGTGILGDAVESEFTHNLIQGILGSMYNGLYAQCDKQFTGIFDTLNSKVDEASERLTLPLQTWNEGAFNTARNIAENACIPIAACIVTFIFCWELIHLMQDSNRMQNIKPENILFVLLKLCICLLVVSKSFDIVMGIRDLGAYATRNIAASTVDTFQLNVELSDVLPQVEDEYEFGMVMELLIDWLVLLIVRTGAHICGGIVYVRVMLWFIEFLMYATPCAIPLATFGNKEWGQMGMNYVRKMLAVSFEGFFMLLAFALYGGVMSGIGNSGDFFESITMILVCGFTLVTIMFKAGSISASIFNAH